MDDAEDYFASSSDLRVTKYLRWSPHLSLDDTRAYLTGVVEACQRGTDDPWGIEMDQERRLIGIIHLMDINAVHLKAEVGVVLNAKYWGNGLGSEALRAVLDFCFTELGLQRVQGMAIAGSTPACRMMDRCGMKHKGFLRHYALQKSQWVDFELCSILLHEFQSMQSK
jgi:[ribosomal protein S5]-alanine N-acetyltransferase